jgi:tellurite resistance protein
MGNLDESLLKRVAVKLAEPPSYAEEGIRGSILTVAAASYGSRSPDVTQPTGFDPQAAALFEAVVESAFLVSNADGDFDAAELDAFRRVVVAACSGSVGEAQLSALLADLADQLEEDGMDKRVAMVGRTITRPEHAREVLRIAGLIAHVSRGVSDSERVVLNKLAGQFQLDHGAVGAALAEVERALTS